MISRLTVLPELGQYARWIDKVCIRVSGVDPAYGQIVLQQVTATARTASVAIAPPGCKPNLMIAFAPNSDQLAHAIADRGAADLFASAKPADRRTFTTTRQPVRWLYTIRKTDSTGVIVGEGGVSAPGTVGAVNEDAGGFATSRYTTSLIDSNLIVGIRGAVIIVDLKRAEGWPLESVAAYVARVALAQTPLPPPRVAAPTILNLFERGPEAKTAAAGLTQWDEAYLKALYRAAPNRAGFQQRHRIQQQMTAILLEEDHRPTAP